MKKMTEFEALVDLIVENPGKHFTSFLYDSSEDDLILLLNKIILIPKNGHQTVVQCLLCWQDLMEFEHGLDPVMTELSQADREDAAVSCLKLINRLIKLAPTTSSRIRIRHELIELGIYDRIEHLRKQFPASRQITLLQAEAVTLLEPDPKSDLSEHRFSADSDSGAYSSSDEEMAVISSDDLLDIDGEFVRLLHSVEARGFEQQLVKLFSNIVKQLPEDGEAKLQKLEAACNEAKKSADALPASIKLPPVAPPMPPPPVPGGPKTGGPPPPPPLPGTKAGPGGPPPPPIGFLKKGAVPQTEKTPIPDALKLPVMPPAGKKFKKLQWTKIPASAITEGKSKNSIWQRLESVHKAFKNKLELNQLDELFECSPVPTTHSNANHGESAAKTIKPQILDSKRKMNVGIFLKQFKDMDLLLRNIQDGNIEGIEQEKLKVMEALLPNSSEIVTLQNYTGDMKALESAETFFMKLIKISDYQLRISTMTFRADFVSFIGDSERQVVTALKGCEELLSSESLRRIFYLFLHMGNYLNADGKTAGFKLNTLWSIDSLRTTSKDGLSLLHIVAQRMRECVEDMKLELCTINESAQIPLENVKDETTAFKERLKSLINRVQNKTDDNYFIFVRHFLEETKEQIEHLQAALSEIESRRLELANYFCETEKSFKLEECFKIFSTFLTRFYNAANDNQQRELRENRRKNMEHQKDQKENEKVVICPSDKTEAVDSKAKLFDFLTAPSTNNNLIQYGSGERRRSVMCVSDRERVESPIIRRKFSSVARTPLDERPLLDPEFARKISASPIFEGTSLDACIDAALDNTRRQSTTTTTTVKRSSSPWSNQPQDSGNDSISISTPSEVSSSTNVSPATSNKTDDSFDVTHSAKLVNLDEFTLAKSVDRPTENAVIRPASSKIKIAQKLPEVPQTPRWTSRQPSVTAKSPTNSVKLDQKSAATALPPRPPTSNAYLTKPRTSTQRSTSCSQEQNETAAAGMKNKVTPAMISAIRGVRTKTVGPELRQVEPKQVISTRPSQVRANSLKKPAECPTTPLSRKPPPSLVSSFRKPAESPTTTRKVTPGTATAIGPMSGLNKTIPIRTAAIKIPPKLPLTPLSKSPTSRTTPQRSPLASPGVRQSFRGSMSSSTSSTSSKPMTAAEKRATQMKPADSVSTASRPTMIRTGSTAERPRWI